MPTNARQLRAAEVENHGMTLRKPRAPRVNDQTNKRGVLNEIGNIARRCGNPNGLKTTDVEKLPMTTSKYSENSSGSSTTSKTIYATRRRTMTMNKTNLPTLGAIESLTGGEALAQVKRKSNAAMPVRRAPRLTLKPPDIETPPLKLSSNVKSEPRLTLNAPQLPTTRIMPTPAVAKALEFAYSKNIYSYLQKIERKAFPNQVECPIELAEGARAGLVDWLARVYHEQRLFQETFQLSVSILDCYLRKVRGLSDGELQLVALSCLSIGIKYEEMIPCSVNQLLTLTDRPYPKRQLLGMEENVFKSIDFRVGRPVAITFLRRYNMAAMCDRVQHYLAKYLVDLAQLDKRLASERPSLLAAAAVFVVICISRGEANDRHWSSTLSHCTTYSYQDIQPIASRIATIAVDGGGQRRSVRRKYSSKTCHQVVEKIEQQLHVLRKLTS